MQDRYVVYGQKGTGSVPVEAALRLIGAPYDVIERPPAEDPAMGGTHSDALAAVNPMQQVPALRLPNGEVITESAAILIHLADSHPAAHLSPPLADPRRPAFLRWMMFVATQIYALVWVRDDPRRLAADEAHGPVILARTAERIAHCWHVMDAQITPGRYLLGDDPTVLDLYVTVISTWGPRRPRFYQEAPKMAEVVRRLDQDPRLVDLWAERLG
jgi:GST-like protein